MKKRKTLQALSTPSIIHGIIESACGGQRARNLWRIDRLYDKEYLLILSHEKPNLDDATDQIGVGTAITKNYNTLLERVHSDTCWHFRLCANPTYSLKSTDGSRGKVKAHITKEHQRAWLIKQGEKHGFHVTEGSFDVVESRWYYFKGNKPRQVSILSVTYEGVLKVTDENVFREALVSGIGRQKAYGLGLLTIMHTEKRLDE